METIYLTHETARWYWERAKQARATLATARRHHALTNAVSSAPAITNRLANSVFGEAPLVVVTAKRGCRSTGAVSFRSAAGAFPRGSFVQLAPGVCVASPELSFLQAASELSFAQTVLYGCALCGTFALDSAADSGTTSRSPLTSAKKLEAFLEKCEGMRGHRAARTALTYIVEGSASPRESKTALLLSLPLRYGGYAMPHFSVNHELAVPGTLRKLAERGTFRIDFFWKSQRVAAEYDSETEGHTAQPGLCRDSTKRIALQEMGFRTFTFTRLQVDRLGLMDESVRALRKLLGVREPARVPEDYLQRKVALRKELDLPL